MQNSITSIPRWMSPRESGTVLPCSSDSSSASSSTCALTSSMKRIITRARRCGLHAAQSFCASTAEATAASTSAAGHRNYRLHLAGAGIEHLSGATGLAGDALAIDEMRDLCGHGCLGYAKDNFDY